MITVLQFLTIAAVGVALAKWGLWRGRKERDAEYFDPRQHEISFETEDSNKPQRGAAMSRL